MTLSFVSSLKRLWPLALLLVTMSSVQLGASLATQLFPLAGIAGTTSLRLILAAVMVLLLARPWRRSLPAGAWKVIVPYGVALGCMNYLFYQALELLPQGVTVALEFTGPLAVALLTSRRVLDVVWIMLAIVGLVILLSPGMSADFAIWPGAFFALGAGACWAGYILFGRWVGQLAGMQGAVWGIVIAAIVAAPIGLWQEGGQLFRIELLWLGLGVAALSTALPYTLEMLALPRLSSSSFGTLMSLEPAMGALSGLFFLGQTLGWLQWLAISGIVIASMGTSIANSQPT